MVFGRQFSMSESLSTSLSRENGGEVKEGRTIVAGTS